MTASELCRRALLSIGVIGETDTPTAEQTADTFQTLNMFLSSLGGSEGFITFQYENPADDIGLDDGYELMIQTNVAVLIAPDYGKEAPPTIQRIATATKRSLKRQTTRPLPLRLDQQVYSGRTRYGDRFDVITGEPF